MDKRQIAKAYAEWCEEIQPDFYFVLNYQQAPNRTELTFEQLSKQVKQLFTRLECIEWGEHKRRRTRKGPINCRIERMVCIEKANYYHANVLMKRYGSEDDKELLAQVKRIWLEIQGCPAELNNNFLFQPKNHLVNCSKAVSLYSNKDTVKANSNNEDVLCLRASFRRKHSIRR